MLKTLVVIALMLLSTWPPPLNGQEVIIARRRALGGGPSAPTYIGSAINSAGSVNPIQITYTPSAAGHALYYFASVGTGSISSLTDSTATPTSVTSPVAWNSTSGGGVFASWMLSGASPSAHTITLTGSAGENVLILYVVELSSSSAAGNTSISSVGNSSANPIPCGSLTTSSGSIVLAFGEAFNGGVTLNGGSGPPSFTVPTPSGSPIDLFTFANIEYSATTTATTYTISSGFAPSTTADPYFCYAVEAKP